MPDRSEIVSLIAVGLAARDGAHPDWCQAQAERLLQQHERARRSELAPLAICRVCGASQREQ